MKASIFLTTFIRTPIYNNNLLKYIKNKIKIVDNIFIMRQKQHVLSVVAGVIPISSRQQEGVMVCSCDFNARIKRFIPLIPTCDPLIPTAQYSIGNQQVTFP